MGLEWVLARGGDDDPICGSRVVFMSTLFVSHTHTYTAPTERMLLTHAYRSLFVEAPDILGRIMSLPRVCMENKFSSSVHTFTIGARIKKDTKMMVQNASH